MATQAMATQVMAGGQRPSGWAARLLAGAILLAGLAACVPAQQGGGLRPDGTSLPQAARPAVAVIENGPAVNNSRAALRFVDVVARVEPVAEDLCRAQRAQTNCDFLIVIDDRPNQPANAYQTLDKSGRPVLGFTLTLIEDARNDDELAFVIGHETAHHIAGHIPQSQQIAYQGAALAGALAQATGAPRAVVLEAQKAGAELGARSYAKRYELEADALGAAITLRAGYDPVRGTDFFDRLPDPGDRFLGTHPQSAQRKEVVRNVVAQYRQGLGR